MSQADTVSNPETSTIHEAPKGKVTLALQDIARELSGGRAKAPMAADMILFELEKIQECFADMADYVTATRLLDHMWEAPMRPAYDALHREACSSALALSRLLFGEDHERTRRISSATN